MSEQKVLKIEGEAAKKIGVIYDEAHKAFRAVALAEKHAQLVKGKLWETIHKATGVNTGTMKLNMDYRKADLLLVEVGAEGEKCPGCGEVHENQFIELDFRKPVSELAETMKSSGLGKKGHPLTAVVEKMINDNNAPQEVKDAWEEIKRIRA